VAATGYKLSAYVLASKNKWHGVTFDSAKKEVLKTLKFMDKTNPEINKGWFHHFVDINTGLVLENWGKEVSTIDTALFFFNAFAAAEYFGGEVKELVEKMFNKIDFKIMLDYEGKYPDNKAFSHGFYVNGNKRKMIPHKWDIYSEGILVPLLSMGSDKIPEEIWSEGWTRWTEEHTWKDHELKVPINLPLFTYIYPHGFIDFKNSEDSVNTNLWEQSDNCIKMQMRYAQENEYPENIWGFTACDGPTSYRCYRASSEDDDGTIAPPIVIASAPFDEVNVKNSLELFKKKDLLNGKYGLINGYNHINKWKASEALGIDIGSMLLMIDAYKDGDIHKQIKRSPGVKKMLKKIQLHKL
jgi:hypothetical protein